MKNTSNALTVVNNLNSHVGGGCSSNPELQLSFGLDGKVTDNGLFKALTETGSSHSSYTKLNATNLLEDLQEANRGLTNRTISDAQMVSIKKLTRLTWDPTVNVSEATLRLSYPIDQKMSKIDSVCKASLPQEYKTMILDTVMGKHTVYSTVVDTESGIQAYFNRTIRPMFEKIPELLTDLLELLQQVSAIKSEDLTTAITSVQIAVMQYVQLIGIILDQRVFSPAVTEVLLSHAKLYGYLQNLQYVEKLGPMVPSIVRSDSGSLFNQIGSLYIQALNYGPKGTLGAMQFIYMHPLGSVSVGIFMTGFCVVLTKLKVGGVLLSMLPKSGQLFFVSSTPSFALGLFLNSCKTEVSTMIKSFFRGLK